MSRHRAELRRQARERRYGVLAGWAATETDLPAARRATHDVLIRLMGEHRTGGVAWRQYATPEALVALTEIRQGALDPALVEHYNQLEALLHTHGGWLVVAIAAGEQLPATLSPGAVT